jgi:hypothetical protein
MKRSLYLFPFGIHKEMNAPALMEKYKQGPQGGRCFRPANPEGAPRRPLAEQSTIKKPESKTLWLI